MGAINKGRMEVAELTLAELRAAFARLVEAVSACLAPVEAPAIAGIAQGGVPLAQALVAQLPQIAAPAVLNASFHRDDFGLRPIPPDFEPTDIPFTVDGATVVLVDDVFATGRTVRAALNELFDYGRPQRVYLACLVDLGQARLPFRPDFVGLQATARVGQKLRLSCDATGPTGLNIKEIAGC